MKKIDTLVEKITDLIAWFLGSWWAVIFHVTWFGIWLVFNLNMDILTLSVSLEAIFIGIFLLMATNKAEIERDLREVKEKQWNREMMKHDIKLDEKGEHRLREFKTDLKEIKEELKRIKSYLHKNR